ncbi:MAG TPA: outer membrane protein transport protein [Stellaceae bacterium]|jgi:long-chain fatty acid transport protein
MKRYGFSVTAVVLACGVVGTGDALASGFQVRENSPALQGTAFAGSASKADDVSTIFNNPAGMTRLSGFQAGGGATLILPSGTFNGGATTAFRTPVAGSVDEDAGTPEPVPNLYALASVTDDLKLGLAVTSPFGLVTTYNSDWVGRYQAIKSALRTIDVNPNVAYRVNSYLSVAGGMSAQYAYTELGNAINSTTVARSAGLPLTLPDGNFTVKGNDWSWGYNFGVLLEPRPDTRIGATYRSRIRQNLTGDASFTVPTVLSALPVFRSGPASAKLVLPDTATLSITHDVTRDWTIMSDVSWTHWSVFKQLTVNNASGGAIYSQPENWRDTVFFALGTEYRPTDKWALRFGVAADRTPVEDQFRTARLPDSNRYWISFGAGYSILPGVTVDAAYTHIFGGTVSINETSPTADLLSGSYDNHVDIFGLSTQVKF